jgi:hypothetical protein
MDCDATPPAIQIFFCLLKSSTGGKSGPTTLKENPFFSIAAAA